MSLINKFIFLFYLPYIILFNFLTLPFRQAIHLPIIFIPRNALTALHSAWLHGKIVIDAKEVKFGMIRLGWKSYFYERRGMSLMCNGTMIFHGSCFVSNSSIIDVKKGATLEWGDNTGVSIIEILCAKSISIGKDTLIGINCMLMDSDFHSVIDMEGKCFVNPSKKIVIGNNNWIGYGCTILKGTKTPDNCVIRTLSVLDRRYKAEDFSILGMQFNTEVVGNRYMHNPYDDNPKMNEGRTLSDEDIAAQVALLNYKTDNDALRRKAKVAQKARAKAFAARK